MNDEQEKRGETAQGENGVEDIATRAVMSVSQKQSLTVVKEKVQSFMSWVLGNTKRKYLFLSAGMFSVLFLLLTTLGFLPHGFFGLTPGYEDVPRQFTKVYSFVPPKLSKSAPIPISLPEGVSEETAKNAITFSPEVKGEWVTEEIANVLLYKPQDELTLGKYYAVTLDTPGAQMSGDFLVDEDPGVVAIFPAPGSETHEGSEITIVFNRPMVPLTSLEVTENMPLPVTITPPTEGRFKWISTRNLQFIPKTTLRPSSDYTVSVGEGLTSIDGLTIPPFTHTFRTRPLRYEYVGSGQIGYRAPLTIQFNQAVNLEKTQTKIRVEDSTGKRIPVDVIYGTRTTYDWGTGTYHEEENRAVLFVYQSFDRHGRPRFWDFDTYYTVTLEGGETLTGTVPLTETRTTTFSTPNIVESVDATSKRSTLVRPDLFDPEGTLTVRFYDEIDIDALDVDVKGFAHMTLSERCALDESGNEILRSGGCVMEPDPRTVLFTFNSDVFGKNESFELVLNRVYTKEGQKISADPYRIALKTYPEFVVTKMSPDAGSGSAAIDGGTVCSSVPLRDLGEDESMKTYLTAGGYIVYGHWYSSRYINPYETWYTGICSRGEFETELKYGLLPQTAYTLSYTLQGAFGGEVKETRSVTTEPPKEEYTRLHNLQQAYNVTRPERTKLTYAAENLETIDLHICKMTPETFLSRTVRKYESTEAPGDGECTEVRRDIITLPRRYWVNNYFQVDLGAYFSDTRGQYVVTLSSPLYTVMNYAGGTAYAKRQLYDRTFVNATNLAVGKKEVERVDAKERAYEEWQRSKNPGADIVRDRALANASNLYWVVDSKTLAPVSGVTVTQYAHGGYEYEPTSVISRKNGVTDQSGIARIPTESRIGGAVVRHGADSTIISDWADQLGYAGRPESASRTYIYTDRPIYRPGHTVYVKGIDRIGFDGSYEVWNGKPVDVVVYDALDNEIYTTSVPVSRYGTFTTSFDIPGDAPLGTYRITAFGQSSYVSVEEYVPAPFKFEMRAAKDEYQSGDETQVDIQADYYFGVPVGDAEVSYGITAQDYYFDRYTDEYFTFGRDWYSCYVCGYGDSFITRGEMKLNQSGHGTLREVIDIEKLFNENERGSKIVTVTATVKDRTGRSVSGSQSFIVHQASYYLGVKTDPYYGEVNEPVTIKAKTVDTEGKPRKVDDLTLIVNKIDWDVFKRQEVDGGYYYRSEEKRTEVKRMSVKTDDDGNWSGAHTFDKGGEYEIVVSGEDKKGNVLTTKTRIYVVGDSAVFTPPNNNYALDIAFESAKTKVGERATLLIKSPYPKAKALITAERGIIHDYWVVDIEGGLYTHTFPVREAYAPNMTFSVLLLSPDPEVKFGSADMWPQSDEHVLIVETSIGKEAYLPGEEVVLEVSTKNANGTPAPAEVSVAVADLSVLALRGNPKKDPFQFFYDGFPLAVTTASNIKNILYEAEIPLGTKGGDGADPDDLAKKKRGVFKDTAYWNGVVVTDQNGKAQVRFTLPDNLTTWQVESLGVTEDTKLGVDYDEFTTRKELMAVPQKPRFVLPGDTFSLGAQVFNQSDRDEEIAVTLTSDTLEFLGERSVTVEVKKGQSKLVYLPVRAPGTMRTGVHSFMFSARTKENEDTVTLSIPIEKNTVYETVATAHFTKDATSTEYLFVPPNVVSDEGGLTINANATLAVFMENALTYMAQYPYGCSEQIASALSTIALITKAQDVPGIEGELPTVTDRYGVEKRVSDVVNEGLARIYEAQGTDGGFSYYKGLRSDLTLSIRVAMALHELRGAGYTIRNEVLSRAVSYIESMARTEYSRSPQGSEGMVILAAYVVHSVEVRNSATLDPLVKSFIGDTALLNERLGSQSLAYLALLTTEGWNAGEAKKVYEALTNRIDIDGRGAYLTSPRGGYYDAFETGVANTALLLTVFTKKQDEHPTMGNVLRWLLQSRDRDGVWGSTQNTYLVVSAFTKYLAWQRETETKFTLTGTVGEKNIFSHSFGGANVFETFTHFMSMRELPKNTLTPLTFTRVSSGTPLSNLYYDMALRYYLPAREVPSRDEGITIARSLYALTDTREEQPLSRAHVGDVVKGKITLVIPEVYSHVAVSDFIPAGFEIVNFNLATEDQTLLEGEEGADEYENEYQYEYGGMGYVSPPVIASDTTLWGRLASSVRSLFGGGSNLAQVPYSYYNDSYYDASYERAYTRTLYPTHSESHDDRVFLYIENLAPGVYEYEYYLRALVPGEFAHMPASAEELYYPEVFGRTSGNTFIITLPQ